MSIPETARVKVMKWLRIEFSLAGQEGNLIWDRPL